MANDESGRPGTRTGPDDIDDLNLLIADEDGAQAAEEEVGQAAEHTVGSTSRPEFATIHLGSREVVDPRLDVDDIDVPGQPGDIVLPLPAEPPQASQPALAESLAPDLEALAAALDEGANDLETELDKGQGVEELADFGHLGGLADEQQGPDFDTTVPPGPAAGRGGGAFDDADDAFDSAAGVAPGAPVSVDNTADTPFVDAVDATGDEDTAIALTLVAQLTDTDGSETLEVAIEGVPAGATLSAGIDEGGGRWAVTEAELVGLTITPPADSDVDFVLTITATSTETASGDTATASKSFNVTVDPVADDPTLAVTADVTGDEDTAIPVTINAALTDTDGSETLVVTVSGVPSGASLSAGTDQGGGVWTLAAGDIPGLTVTPPADSDGDFTLTVTATAIDGTDTASLVDTINVTVDAVADAPALTVADAAGDEDTAIALSISPALTDTDGSESLAVTISGVPAGAALSAGTDTGGGVWTLTPAQLAGLTITPPADSDVDFALTVTATSTEADGGDTATTVDTINVAVNPVADTPTLTVTGDVTGDEDTAIPLTIASALTDTDGSESLAITVAGVPAGAALSAGTDAGGGVWTLTPAQLAGLTVTPPADSDGDFALTVTATSTDGADTASTVDTINVTVDAVADAPTLTVADTSGDEDTAIPLTISSALTDTDGSESLGVTVSGVPAGAALSAGTDTGGGVWTLTPAQLAGLTITPPADSDGDFTLTVTATSTEADGGDTATTVDTIDVTVDPVADTPTLTVTGDVTGNEDSAIPLTINPALTDTDGSESLMVTVAGVPAGASLSAGTDTGGGVWTLTPAQLAGLTITPPADSDGDFALTVTATATEADGGATATSVDTINVTVDAVADAPTLTVADASGDEDTAIALSISSALTDTDGSESLAVTISGVPAGASLSAGSDQGGGVWTLTPAQLAGLTVTPPADSDGDFTLTVTAISTEADGGDTATTVDTIDVTVDPVADTPTLTVADASGDEDTAIALTISSALTDTDGSESLAITVAGVPAGAALSAGTDTGGGVWTLTPAQLTGLTITPPADSDGDCTLTVTATSTDGADTASTVDTIDVRVDAVADAPALTVADVSGNEDSAIPLSISSALTDTDGSESLAITVSGVPSGASLSAGSDQGVGVWTLTPAQLAGLTITPPADSDGDFTLTVTSTATEADGGDTATTVDTIDVTVDAVADAPTLTVADASGDEDTAIALDIASALTDTDGSESLAITISGVPSGASLSAGADQGGGVWTLTPAQLAGLTITPPADDSADFTLTITSTATEADGGDTATTVDTLDVTVTGVADPPTLTVSDATGDEDTAIPLTVDAALTDSSETLTITISDVPTGASLSAGSDQGGGVWTLTPAQLAGLTVTPPADSDGDFTLTVTATSEDDGDTATTVDTIDVTVDAVADAPTLTVADASGNEDGAIPLSISSALTDTDGSESLAVTVSGVPSGATLSAGSDQGGGVWTLTPAQLAGLTITPPADSDGDFTLTVTSTATEADGGDTATTVDTIDVTVDAVADAPTLTVADASGDEDTAIPLTISSALTDTDGSESLAITVSGVPSGASLSAGSDQGGGVWTLTPAQLAGLTITPPADSDGDFALTVTATSTEADGGDTATTVDTINVTVDAVADAPTLTVADTSGDEDTAIPLSISSALTDTDGSESLAITVSGVPSGAGLSAGSDQGGGVWTLTPAQLAGLTITPPADSDADFTLTVTSTTTEADGGDTATTVDTIDVTVDPVADAPTLTVADASGDEDTAIALNIASALTDTDGSESLAITLSGVPAGASLSAGSDQGGGVWTLTPAQLAGLTVTPPADDSSDFTLTVTATSTDGGDTATTVDTLDVTVAGVADAPTLTVADTSGDEDTAIPLSIDAALTDSSETLSVTVSGVPAGASLSAGSDQGGGVWTLTPAQLAGLTVTPPADSDGDFTLTVTATSEDDGDTATTVDTIDVTVDPVADAPTLTVADASGDEDTAIPLTLNAALTDTDGSESLAITISDVPAGASLSAGSDQGGGVWTLTPAQLAGLTITPPADSDGDFTLTVTAVATDGADTATTIDTIDVTVDPVADAPTLTVADASGDEDTAIPLSVSSALTDTDGSESLAITISGVPSGASLSAGADQGGGVWTLTPAQLAGLTVTPPADSDGDFTLTVTATSTDGADTASTVDTIDVTVDPVADAPTLTVADASGDEDTAIALSISSALTDTDGSESLAVTISGVPSGASLSAGADQGGGVWTLTPVQLAGLTITPPADSDGDFTLTVTSTSTDGSDTASTADTIDVTVDPVADAPTLTVADTAGQEDTAIPLSISSALTDTDGSESLAITVSGVPAGASLSAGADQGGGVWTLTPAQLAGLTITPALDDKTDFTLTVTATSTDGADTATTVDTIDVEVTGVADAPNLTVADVTGDEDTAIALNIDASLSDPGETLSVTVAGLPSGASLSAGSDQGGGVWTLTPAQLAGLTITPPADSDGDFTLTVTATSNDDGDTADTVDTMTVTVDAVADAPTLTVADASGDEDTAIALSISSALTDTDGSESLAVTISGVPSGASLSAGADQGGGVWTLTPAQLAGLTITPPADSDADFTLTVTSTSTEADGGDTATTVDTIDVTVDPVADAPTLTVADASGDEDTAIPLSISSALTDTDGSESLAVTISGVPTGASLSAGADQGGGVWTLTPAQLAGLTVTPPADSDVDFTLTVTATSTDGGDTATTVDTIDVTVDPVADAPTLTVTGDVTGNEDGAIPLTISSALTDTDGSESLAVTISGVPSGASLSAGSDQGGGVWTLTPAQLAGLTITPPADSDADFALTVTATSTDGADTASTVDTINVTVDAVADAPTLTVADASGDEDTAIALSLSSALTDTDGSESLAVTISGVPAGASLSAGSDQGGGVWTLTPAQLAGLTITPPSESDADFTLTVTATSTEADGGDTATTVDTVEVTVNAVADAPTLTVADASGDEDTAIALSISSALTDTDGSETLAVTISGVPTGASLSAGSDQGGGVWTLTPAQLAGLTITPPADSDADFTLTVTSTSTETDGGDTATTVDTIDVTVDAVADAPTLTVADATGDEDTAIALSISSALTDTDGSESLAVTVSGVPAGASLSAGSDQGGGVWTLTPAQLAGLTITPPADSDGDFALTVTSTSTEADGGDTATTVDTIDVTVDPVADAPTLTVADASGDEDTAIALSVASALTDTDGSESLAVTISGVPSGASLSAGSDQGGGVWTLTPAQLAGLTVTPPADDSSDFTLTVTATSTDGADTASTVDTIDVTVAGVADAPTLTVADASGDEDTAISLSISSALTDASETLTVTVSGVPSGASLSAGSDQGGGVWTLTPAQLAGLTITPPADSDADFTLTVTATSEDDGDTATTVDTIDVTVDPVADAPTLTVADATGTEDTAIALSVSSALTDTDGSESLAVTISGVPAGAALSAGSDQGSGVWTLTPAQLAGLTVTPPADSDGDFTLTVTATSTDGADTATTVDTVDVTVNPEADAPTLTVADASGDEDTAIALSISSALTDTDGSETLAVTISGVPTGAALSAGSDQGSGVWTLTPAQLAGLTITPPADSDGDFTLTVTATSTEADGGDTATTVDTIDVTVDPVADAPTLTVADASGDEDTPIALSISSALTDTDGSESLAVTISGVPSGASLSAGSDQGGGVWTLTPAQLAGLTVTPPADSDADFTLTVTATSTDGADTATTVDTIDVTVDPVADAPTLTVADVSGDEDTAIALSISSALTDTDGSESLALTVSGVPTGATLSAGSDQGGGVWTLTPAQLAGLTITPPNNDSSDFTLTVTATSTDGSDTAATVDTIDVTVTGVADAPTLTVADATGDEDTAIALSIASAVTDPGESLAITISGVPSGASLSAGSDQGGGVWTLTPAQLAGLTITPPADSDADFTLTVTATSTDGSDTADTIDTIDVTVDPVADAPTLTVADATGDEDSAIALSISSALTDTDGSESLAVTISGVPAGASLSAGTDTGGGVWTLTPAQLAGLTVTPSADSDADFTLTVTATSTDGADTATTVDTIDVTVDAVADAPTLTVADASGDEDAAIALSISSALTDTDGSESLAITVSGVPSGASLSAGSDQGGGVWTLTPAQLAGLTITPPADSDADFTLTVTAAATDGSDTATTVDTIDVTVDPVADAPTLTVADVTGGEDSAIPLSISSALTDTDGSESLAITVSGVPVGAALSAGSDQGGGVWTLTPAQLAGLTITPPLNDDADFTLTVTATSTDGADTANTVDTIDVTVDGDADAPTLTVADASGDEDTAIALSINAALTDASETLAVTVSGVPSGASLSAGSDQGGGVWTLTPAQLAGLTITPPADSDADFTLTVTATSTDGADSESTVDTIDVTVDPVADAPTLTVADATGNEDSAIALSISSALTDTDGSESLAVTISGVPAGASLSAGSDQGGGVWTLTPAQLAGLTVTPPSDSDADFTLTVTATSTDGADTATTVDTIDVTVDPVADAPTLTVADATGNEDSAIALSVSSALTDTDGSESLAVTISGVPSGASLSAGSDQGGGVWTLTPAQLAGLTITPPADSDADFTLTVTATSTDGADTASTVDTIDVTVDAVADTPTLTVTGDVTGDEDTAIPLTISSALTDTDGSETLAVTISGVPAGASLSAGSDQGGGVWTLTPAQLAGLTVTPPADSDADFTLTVTSTATETTGGDTATTVDTIDVTVDPVADAPTLTIADVTGDEDTGIALNIAAAASDPSETLTVTVSGVPAGAGLSAGTDTGGGVWTLTEAQLAGLTVTPPADSDVDFTLTVTATATDGSDTTDTVDTMTVTVDPVADAPTLTVTGNVTGNEDSAIALTIASALTDTDGSESLAVTISGVPSGASLSAGSDQGGGVWTLTPAQLAGLTVTPPADSDADFTLTVTATSTDGADTAASVDTINVTVDAVADAPTLTVADVTGVEDNAIALNIASALSDTDGSESLAVTVSGVPAGASLSAGSDQGGGVWTLTPAQLAGLTVTPPTESDADFTLTITSTATEADGGDTASTVDTMTVTVNPEADAPTLTVADASGDEDTAIALSISSALTDTDGSETLAVTISGVPSGASLSAGSDQGGGVWTLTPAQLAGLTITPPADSDADFTLTVTSTSTETDGGDTATTVDTIDVTVDPVADAPTLTVADATGNEDTAIALSVASALTDTDGSETLSVTIAGVPSGASLSAGSDQGGGVWTLTPAQLAGLTITPPADSDADFTLTVTAVSADGGDLATTVDTIDVTVDAVADAPTLTVADASGTEDTAIALSISSALTDTDGSESLAVTISGVPAGASLSAGSDQGGGVWTLTPAQLAGLTITPPADDSADFTLTVTATSTEADGGDTATTVDTIDVTVTGDADAPTLTVADATGDEDTAIALSISSALTDTDGSETLAVTISGVPSGASLSAGSDQGGGVWTLTAAQLAGLAITPPADSDADFTLTVTATATDDGDTASTVDTINVTVDAVADAPTISGDVTGNEDAAIPVTFAALSDTDGSESLAVTVSGVPAGASLSAGTDQGGGTWTLTGPQLAGLTITPPADSDADFTLTVSATSTEADGGDTATTVDTMTVTVDAVADAPTLTVTSDVTGNEDRAVDVDVSAPTLSAAVAGTTVIVSGMPAGAALNHGVDNGDGSWTVDPADLADLMVTPPDGSSADIPLTVTVNGPTTEIQTSFDADAGGFSYSDDAFRGTSEPNYADGAYGGGYGQSGGGLRVDLGGVDEADVTDMSGGWSQTFNVPDNATGSITFSYRMVMDAGYEADEYSEVLASVDGTLLGTGGNDYVLQVYGDGNGGSDYDSGWQTITLDLGSLTPGNHTITLGGYNNQKTVSGEETQIYFDNVEVNTIGDIVSEAVVADIETGIPLTISGALTDTDGSEALSYTIAGVPTGASLSAGSDQGGGVWTLTPAQLAGLTIDPADDSDADFTLTVTAVSTEADGGDTATTVETINVTVDAVADVPTLTVTSAVSGNEDRAEAVDVAPATLAAAVPGTTVVVSGVPVGAELSSGVDNGDGTWTVQPENLDGLMITPPSGSSADIPLTVDVHDPAVSRIDTTFSGSSDGFSYSDDTFRSTSEPGYATGSYGGGYGESGGGLRVDLGGVDGADITNMSGGWSQTFNVPADATGTMTFSYRMVMGGGYENDEYSEVLASIDGTLVGTGGNDYLLQVYGDGNSGPDYDSGWQTVTIDLGSLSAGNHTLTLGGYNNKKTTSDEDTQIYFDNVTLDTSAVVSEAVTVDIEAGIPLTIASSLTDTDGSETLTFTIEGVPTGAALSAGTDQGGGVWTLTAAQLAGLTFDPAPDSDGDVPLTIIATATDSGGETSTTTDTIVVTVNPVNDAPVAQAGVAETPAGTAIDGQLYATDDDMAGTLTYALDTDGAFGTVMVNADGTYTYTPDDGFVGSDSFTYVVTDASGATTTQTITVEVVPTIGIDTSGGTETQVNSTTSSNQDDPSVAGLADGGYVVVWESYNQDGDRDGVFGQRFDANGNTVGGEFQINTTTTDNQYYPDVIGLDGGGFVVVYSSDVGDGSGDSILGQRFNSSGTAVGGEFQVNTTTSSNQREPSIASLDDGGFVVVFRSDSGDGSGDAVLAQRYDASGNTVGGEFLVNTTTGSNQFEPDVVGLSDGGFIVVWTSDTGDGSGDSIQAQRYDASGNAVGSEFQVNTTTSSNQREPAVAALAGGGFVVVFRSDSGDGSGDAILAQHYDANGNTVGSEFLVNSYTSGNQMAPKVTGLLDGGYFVTWRSASGDGSGDAVFGQQYDQDGNTVGSEIQINTTTSGDQDTPDVTVLDDGSVVVVWESANLDGSGDGIASKTYQAVSYGPHTMTGGAGNDTFIGGDSADTISAGAGADTVEGGAGGDNLDGGAGIDTLAYAASATGVTVDLGAGTGSGGDAAGDTISNFENVIGSANADDITGDANANVIEGGAGADAIDGAGGTDTATYAGSTLAVNVSLASGTGSGGDAQGDALTNIENLIGSDWDDTLTGDGGDNVIEGGLGADVIDGGAGIDTASYAGSTAAVTIDLNAATASGGDAAGDTISNVESVIGSNFDDVLTGDGGDNTLAGGMGDDTVSGGAGADTLTGDEGSDLLIGGAGDDVFLFGAGDDDDTVQGGVAGGWTDTIALDGVTGDYLTGDWTLTLTSGSIESAGTSGLTLSADAEGSIIIADGSTVTFEGIEQIQW